MTTQRIPRPASRFTRLAKWASHTAGRPAAFTTAFAILLLWAVSGPFLGFSNTWQLVINTTTTIVTFLMVFLIQNTQNRDSEALHVKIDELIRATRSARNTVLDLEELEEHELDALREEYEKLARRARAAREQRKSPPAKPRP
jgi:low affinity Fe/Cu permease